MGFRREFSFAKQGSYLPPDAGDENCHYIREAKNHLPQDQSEYAPALAGGRCKSRRGKDQTYLQSQQCR